MKQTINLLSILCVFLTVVFTVVCCISGSGTAESLAITFGTISYHFLMRLSVGGLYHVFMHNRADYHKRWFFVSEKEMSLYKKLKVKKWKNHMPTYDASLFDPKVHSWDEIAQAMCQAELVHETIVVLSFLPIFAGRWFGAVGVFVLTSVAAACLDGMFVIMQRYNRPRVVALAKKWKKA